MKRSSFDLEKEKIVKSYFSSVDSGKFPSHLFDDDFSFYFPKYGIGRGVNEFIELSNGAGKKISRVAHRIDDLLVIIEGSHVVVEGTTEGAYLEGKEWRGGETPGGRFCSVFSFNAAGLIARMHIYLDPDYTGEHQEGFLWQDRQRQEW